MSIKYPFFWCLLIWLTAPFLHGNEIDSSIARTLIGREIVTKNRFEIGAFFFDTSLRNSLVKHPYAAHLALGYHIYDELQVEVTGGYVFIHQETNFIKQVRAILGSSSSLPLPELWQTKWQVGLNVQWIPFYGKLSFFSEIQTHFQLYLLLGGALEGVMRVLDKPDHIQDDYRYALNLGAGTRLFLTDRIALRSEIKQSVGFNQALANGVQDISWTTWFLLGVGFLI